ncbi:YceI family protein [Aggregatilinea lenta]|uniref:YceI family protein n=1 Tax=Aggregatilinea lenta TaxID=913108 RepID=UPI000E5A3FB9|nr:YceI family protein [Aggregatilinea lenta]
MAWQIDNAHSAIQFTVRHMMISNVRGMFDKFEGTVDLDENNPENTTVHVEIDPSSINTRQDQRDTHLRSADFLDAESYPKLIFDSTRVERTGDNAAKLYGNLTVRNVTKPVVLDVEYVGQAKSPWGTTSAGFNASTKINRKDWGLTWNQGLETGGVLVGDEIKINIELELVKQESEQAASAGA